MATIFGISGFIFAYPEQAPSRQNRSIGRATNGDFKFRQYRSPDRYLPIFLRKLTAGQIASLKPALESAIRHQGTIIPDTNVDLGAGAGTPIIAQWIDDTFNPTRDTPFFDIDLNFIFISTAEE